uniref:SERPIN domain-containing protein n=1 Tax=Ascaris lumbricoides TaxID=6252 RepID=A0A0M3ILY5_ASCLU
MHNSQYKLDVEKWAPDPPAVLKFLLTKTTDAETDVSEFTRYSLPSFSSCDIIFSELSSTLGAKLKLTALLSSSTPSSSTNVPVAAVDVVDEAVDDVSVIVAAILPRSRMVVTVVFSLLVLSLSSDAPIVNCVEMDILILRYR